MNQNNNFEDFIRSALVYGEERIELNTASLNKIKNSLKMKNERDNINMSVISRFSKQRIKKAAVAICTLAVVTAAAITFIQPVGAFADKVKTMIYDVVKGDNGKYVAVKIPYEEPKTENVTGELPAIDKANPSKSSLEMPLTLSGGYDLYNQSAVAYNTKNGSSISVDKKNGSKLTEIPSLKIPKGWKAGTSFWYHNSNASSVIIVCANEFNNAFVTNAKGEPLKGDNQKELKISGQPVVYAEYPDPRYPYVNNTEDRTQAPSIHVAHTLMWDNNGKYYVVYDFNGDLNLDVLKTAATTIIESLK